MRAERPIVPQREFLPASETARSNDRLPLRTTAPPHYRRYATALASTEAARQLAGCGQTLNKKFITSPSLTT